MLVVFILGVAQLLPLIRETRGTCFSFEEIYDDASHCCCLAVKNRRKDLL